MNKYKTVEEKSHKYYIEDIRSPKVYNKRNDKETQNPNNQQHTFLSSDKSIIFLKSPKITQPINNSFRSSLYQSSLKRLKQQRIAILNETLIPSIKGPRKKTYQSLEEEAIRRVLQEGKELKQQYLPIVNRLAEQTMRHKYHSIKIDKKSEQKPFQRFNSVNNDKMEKNNGEEESQSRVKGYRNLKQKYIELKQLTLNKRKSELLDKPQYRRYQNESPTNPEMSQTKFRMSKDIEDHMNRYDKKKIFQTKVNGMKTTIYPAEKAHIKIPEEVQGRKRECQAERQEHIQNFIKRKRNYNQLHPIMADRPSQFNFHINLEKKKQSEERAQKVKHQSDDFERSQACSPWETEAANFDRF